MVARARQEIQNARKILLTTHQNPDGDGLGSEVAFASFLRGLEKEVRIVNPDATPERYRFLDPAEEVLAYDEGSSAEWVRNSDLIVTLDNSSLHRMGSMEQAVRGAKARSLCIDHHSTTDPFWTLSLIDDTACATGEMIYDLIRALGGDLDAASAAALYTAMVTDTGNFRFSKTTPRSHRIAAELLAKGVNPSRIYELVYEQQQEGFVRLMGVALAGFRLEAEGRLGWIAMTHRQIVECGADNADTSEMVNHLFTIRGVRICLLFKELPDGKIKVSFRSKGDLDVHSVATAYGGGGHQNASGAVVDGPIESAVSRVVADARALLR
jgi:phosphoesterase RecJ-like protein